MLKLKDNVDFSVLRDFGFQTGRDVNEDNFFVNDCDLNDWWKFLRYDDSYGEDCAGHIIREDGVAEVSIQVCVEDRKLWVEVTPIASYHVECHDLDVVTDTIFQLVKADIVEVV